ncbi:hypothetical protein [Emticicia sp. C21]|uniref:hypothetical protein n=1 Tax=Emticicia sp. C21 TaxID=2302915 RepID=UPI001314A568|nr:hypothetical protein [Emticicia sp. C21]
MNWSIYKVSSLFKRAISYTNQQIVSEAMKVPATKMEPEKVTNMVGTFFERGQ